MPLAKRTLTLLGISLLCSCAHPFGSGGSCSSPPSALPQRLPGAPSGSEFAKEILKLSANDREVAIIRELRRGNLPQFLRKLSLVKVQGRDSKGQDHLIKIWVTPDYLSVGHDTDYLRVPMTPQTAQRLADSYGLLLPTTKIVDEIYKAAELKLSPEILPPGPQMVSVEYFVKHNEQINLKLERLNSSKLLAGHKKDIVLSNRLSQQKTRVAIYGWHKTDTEAIQPLSLVHGSFYADYSHGLRLVHPIAELDGVATPTIEIITDPNLANLLSNEGSLKLLRYPNS